MFYWMRILSCRIRKYVGKCWYVYDCSLDKNKNKHNCWYILLNWLYDHTVVTCYIWHDSHSLSYYNDEIYKKTAVASKLVSNQPNSDYTHILFIEAERGDQWLQDCVQTSDAAYTHHAVRVSTQRSPEFIAGLNSSPGTVTLTPCTPNRKTKGEGVFESRVILYYSSLQILTNDRWCCN